MQTSPNSHPRTPVRGSPDGSLTTVLKKTQLVLVLEKRSLPADPCVSLRAFAASRETKLPAPQSQKDRTRAGKPELRKATTRGLPSAARLTENRTPKTAPNSYSYSVRPGGRYSYSYSKNTTPAAQGTHKRKPEANSSTSTKNEANINPGHSSLRPPHHLRFIRANPCSSVAKKQPPQKHPWHLFAASRLRV